MIEKYSNCLLKDSKLNILMIAEKPSIARTITKFLSGNKYKIYHHQTMTIFTFKGYFKTIKSYFTVTSVKGHIYENEYIHSYDKSKPTKSYDYNIIKVVKNTKINIPKFLRYIAKNKDILCLWIDCDPEGENICYEVIHNVLPNMNKKKYQQVYRAVFSSLTYRDIHNDFDNLKCYPNCQLSMSVDARSIIDYKVGISFSNLLTCEVLEFLDRKEIKKRKDLEEIFRNKYILSYGPCQTPSLYFCVQRKREIEKFIPSILYKIYVEIITNEGKIYKIYMERKFDRKNSAKIILDDLKKNFWIKVENIEYRRCSKNSPVGLKTTTMLKMASTQLKISLKEASDIAQQLYMGGFISYPRTGSTKYSRNFNFWFNLRMFKGKEKDFKGFSENVKKLIQNYSKRNIDFQKGVERDGHQPIIPTRFYNSDYPKEKKNLFNLICLHYFASLSPSIFYITKEYKMKVGDYPFIGTSYEIIDEGFLKFQPYERSQFFSDFPDLKEKKSYRIINYGIEEEITEPPDYLTEAELIDKMEKYSIGTNGTIPSHINNLSFRGYVKVDKKKRVIPTRLGMALIDMLEIVEPDIIKPENRQKIEEFVWEIETGKKDYKEALDSAIEFYKKKFTDCCSKVKELKDEFGKYFKLIKYS